MEKSFEIISSKYVDKIFGNMVGRAFKTNFSFFDKQPGKFKIIVCHTQREFKKESKYYYQKWGTATVLLDGKLVIKSPNISTKWKLSDYPNILRHDISHVFWIRLYKTNKPLWLNEGLACIIGNNFPNQNLKRIINKYKVNYGTIHYRSITKKVTGHLPFYPVWKGFTEFLIKKKGKKGILHLMETYSKNPMRENYDNVFKSVYKITEKEAFRQFLETTDRLNIKIL